MQDHITTPSSPGLPQLLNLFYFYFCGPIESICFENIKGKCIKNKIRKYFRNVNFLTKKYLYNIFP